MISVIMPVYNAEKFLKRSIDSILGQTEKDLELIIINDGSTDTSEEIIFSYDDPRIVYVKQENKGVANARNKGLDIAKGEFIAWQDADDVSLPTRLEIMKKSFDSPSIGFVHCDMFLAEETGHTIGYWQYRNTEKSRLLRYFLKKGIPYSNGSTMLRAKAIAGERYDTTLKVGEDADMFFRIGLGWNSVHISKPLYIYYVHKNSISTTCNQSEKAANIKNLLSRHSLEELVPELNWDSADNLDNEARACAIISLLLSQRGLKRYADEWIKTAIKKTTGLNGRLFVRGISLLQDNKHELAKEVLKSYPIQDCVTINYLGEIAAFCGDSSSAYKLFMRALEINPHYIEPVDNLRGLGGFSGFRLVDTYWLKFKKAS